MAQHSTIHRGSRGRLPTASALAWLNAWRRAHAGNPVFRPGNASGMDLPPQRLPRRLFQTVNAGAPDFAAKSKLLRIWRDLNPEYDWHLFSESDCSAFVRRVADPEQAWAYESLAVGAMRADYFRVLILVHLGGVYADIDVVTRRGLRTIIPPDASMVATPRHAFEFLLAEPHHPLLQNVAWDVAMQVRKQVLMHRHGKLCDGPNECVIAVTGPAQYKSSMESAATRLGCEVNSAVYPYFRGCTRSRSGAVAATFVCADEDVRVTTWITRGWDCGIAFHRRCVTARKRQSCSGVDARNKSEHYTDAANQRKYFHLDVPIPSLIPGALRPAARTMSSKGFFSPLSRPYGKRKRHGLR